MADRLDDVKLTVKIDVESAERSADKVEKREKEKKARRERDRERKEKEKSQRGKFGQRVGQGRHAIQEIAQGRVPASRFGRGMVRLGQIMIALQFAEIVGGALSNFPVIGGISEGVARGIKQGKAQVGSSIDAFGKTRDYLAGKRLAGREIGEGEAKRVFDRFQEGSYRQAQLQIQKELLVAPEMAPIMAKVVGETFQAFVLNMPVEVVKGFLRPIVGDLFKEEVRRAQDSGGRRR